MCIVLLDIVIIIMIIVIIMEEKTFLASGSQKMFAWIVMSLCLEMTQATPTNQASIVVLVDATWKPSWSFNKQQFTSQNINPGLTLWYKGMFKHQSGQSVLLKSWILMTIPSFQIIRQCLHQHDQIEDVKSLWWGNGWHRIVWGCQSLGTTAVYRSCCSPREQIPQSHPVPIVAYSFGMFWFYPTYLHISGHSRIVLFFLFPTCIHNSPVISGEPLIFSWGPLPPMDSSAPIGEDHPHQYHFDVIAAARVRFLDGVRMTKPCS